MKRAICAFVLGALLQGCSTVPTGERGLESEEPRIVRDEASVDYDVLVGEFALQAGHVQGAHAAFLRASRKDPESAYIQRRLSQLSLKLERIDEAVVHAARAVAIKPEDENARLFLARIHRVRLDLGAVESVLLDEEGEPYSPRAALLLYQVYLERTRLSEALRITRDLVAEKPEMLDAHMALATVYEHLGRRELAVEVMRDALEIHPNRPILYSRLSRMLRAMGNRGAEIELYREVLLTRPHHYGTLVALGEAQIALNDLEGALETYREITEHHPDDLQAMRRFASLEFAAGRYEQAAERLREAFEKHPEHYELAYSLGQVLRNLGKDDTAVGLFELVPDYHPSYVEARLQLASIHEDHEDYAAALVEVQRLRLLRPSRQLEFHTAELLTRLERVDEAVSLLQKMRDENPDDDEILYQLGVCYGTSRQVDKALEYMRLTLEKNPDNPHALNYVGYTFAERGENLVEAERMILRALDQRPNDGYIADSLGWVYYMRGFPLLGTSDAPTGLVYLERARDQLFLAAELTGGDPVISEHLGDVYLALSEPANAYEHYQEAVRLEHREDEQPHLLEKLERLRQQLGAK